MARTSKYLQGPIPHEHSARDATIEEERRLFCVALTRAQRHITFFEALSRNRHGREKMCETSRFLNGIPENLINKRIHAAKDMVEARVEPNKNQPKPRKTSRRGAKPPR
ncbi:MAG: 3'-5' exonuclease [Candidatus Hydrogenedentes bacterium]|nr:3'-5' exonuclease [Candidatus Hydrogenedentota bacterium]